MLRALAFCALFTVAALLAGCSSSSNANNSNTANTNANMKSNTAPSATSPAMGNSGPTVGGAAPPQARPSSSTTVGIKPPTKNGR